MTTRTLLALVVLTASLPAGARAAKWDGRLGDAVSPTFQSIRLTLDPGRPDYEGTTTIELDVREAVDSFRLHAEGIELESLTLAAAGESEGKALTAGPVGDAEDVVELGAARALAPGTYTLRIAFRAPYDTTAIGLYRLVSGGNAYAFTQFESDDAREAFPCFDEPSFKIPFQVTLTTPADDVAITNTPVESESVADGMRTTVFARTKPLPTYLLALAVGPFDLVDIPDFPFPARIVTPAGQGGLAGTATEETLPVLRALEAYFDRPYPYAKLDLIAVPEFWPGAMEHPGAITFRDTILLLDPERVTPGERDSLVRVIAHELAHQWFGNLVTLAWWDDLWLNESFADWMGDRVTEEVHPEFRTGERELQGTQGVLRSDARPSSPAIRRPIVAGDPLMDGIGVTYNKGKLVLAMFEAWVGAERFRNGVLDYLKENEWGNATASDLWRALDRATGRPVSAAMNGFLEQPGFPILEVRRTGARQVTIRQRRFHAAGVSVPPQLWQVPIRLHYADDLRIREAVVLLDREEKTFDLPVDDHLAWIYPNGGARGYYRWLMSRENLENLTRAASASLEPRERIELVGNLGALVDAGEMRADDYLEMLLGFAEDARPTVCQSVLEGSNRIQETFPDADLEEEFAVYVRHLLAPALDRIGLERRPGEEEDVTTLRPRLLGVLGGRGRDAALRERAREKTEAFLADAKAVDPTLAGTWLSLAARDGDADLWDTFRARFESATVPRERSRYLSLLGDFEEPRLRERALSYSLQGPLRPQEVFTIPRNVAQQGEAEQDEVVDWLLARYDEVVARMPPPSRGWLVFVGNGCSQERWNRVRDFFSADERQVPGMDRRIRRVDDAVADCLAMRTREEEHVRAFLADFAARHRGDETTR